MELTENRCLWKFHPICTPFFYVFQHPICCISCPLEDFSEISKENLTKCFHTSVIFTKIKPIQLQQDLKNNKNKYCKKKVYFQASLYSFITIIQWFNLKICKRLHLFKRLSVDFHLLASTQFKTFTLTYSFYGINTKPSEFYAPYSSTGSS